MYIFILLDKYSDIFLTMHTFEAQDRPKAEIHRFFSSCSSFMFWRFLIFVTRKGAYNFMQKGVYNKKYGAKRKPRTKRFWHQWTKFFMGLNHGPMLGFSRQKKWPVLLSLQMPTQPFQMKTKTFTNCDWIGANWQMLQTLGPVTLRFVNRSCLRSFIVRAFSSSSGYEDQSRGGLPRFHSETLPNSKVFSSPSSILLPPSFHNATNHILTTFQWNFTWISVVGIASIWNTFKLTVPLHVELSVLYKRHMASWSWVLRNVLSLGVLKHFKGLQRIHFAFVKICCIELAFVFVSIG